MAYPENELGKTSDITVKVPGQIFNIADEEKSVQPMASLMEKSGLTSKQMEERHTNLEGVTMSFA